MENSRFTSRDSQPNWVVDIPKEQTGKVLSTIELWAHQNKYMYCGREHEESESCFFVFSYFHSLLYHNWMSVCNTSSGEHSCTGFLVNACSGYNQTATAYRGVLRLEDFLTVMLCALRKKKKKKSGAELETNKNQQTTTSHFQKRCTVQLRWSSFHQTHSHP